MRRRELPRRLGCGIPAFPADAKGIATREASGKVLNAIAPHDALAARRRGRPGALDQDHAEVRDAGVFEAGDYGGRNIHFGIREHGMGADANGMALAGLRPYGAHLPGVQRLHAAGRSASRR